jgi:polar amino acid transport system substrate-binding protein
MNSKWIAVPVIAFLIGGCASSQVMPTAEEKQALAPTGKLRVGFQANNAHATKDPASGEFKGPAIDLGKELARRLGVPFVPVQYQTVVELVNSVSKGEWDVLSIGVNPERTKTMEFSPAYSQIESGYLVGKDVRISAISEVDRPGMRIAVLERGDSDVLLSQTLKNATLIRTRTFADALSMVRSGSADAMAFLKTGLYPANDQLPGSRILEGLIQVQDIAVAVPKGRNVSAGYVKKFVEELKVEGFFKRSIDRAGVRGLTAAP